jgi:uroporphyrinogen III methyltransferase/synthase
LEEADVILYDYLANPALLAHARPESQRIYVGRRGRGSYQDQAEVNRLMIDQARQGKVVVRLKGGDPFVFGRGGEEAEAVAAAGIPFEVVPGVTAAVAVPAYAGIPVTHRTMASSVTFITGHEDPEKEGSALEWPRLATGEGTLVFLMGMKNLPRIVEHLVAEGKSIDTPVALIRWGTRPAQQTVIGTLADIVKQATAAHLEPPTVIVVGEVVRLREQLNWFEKRPLFGKRILITRARDQAPELSGLLRAFGAEPIECPTIEIVPPLDWKELDEALAELPRFQWLVFTSANGIRPFMQRLQERGGDLRALAGLTICCIGPRTAQELRRYGLHADIVPTQFQAEGVLQALEGRNLRGQGVLIPRAAVAREILPEQLRAWGADVRVVTAYRTVLPELDRQQFKDVFRRREIDLVTFTSSSTVRNFAALFDSADEMQKLMAGIETACIGPISAATARECGLPVTIMPAESTGAALVEAIVRHAGMTGRKPTEIRQQ